MSDTGYQIRDIEMVESYREESIQVPAAITLLLLLLVLTPMLIWIARINRDGTEAANVTQYESLVAATDADVQWVSALLRNDTEELEAILESNKKPVVTLVVPEVVLVDKRVKSKKGPKPLKAELDGIYYVKGRPLASLGGETYRVGDKVQDYTIITIEKTKVHLRAPDGSMVVKDMYEEEIYQHTR